jgi:Zn-dependent protease
MQIFSFLGIPIKLHYSFLILGAIWVFYNGFHLGITGVVFAIGLGVALFGSVLLHELGHSLMAATYGISTRHITLYPFGGIAAIESEPNPGLEEFFIALAGPAVNFILAGLLAPAMLINLQVFSILVGINLAMGIFNLIPAFPMDGGRILRSALMTRFSKRRSTIISLNVSLAWSVIFLIVGCYFQWYGLILVSLFLAYIIRVEKKRMSTTR